VSFRRKLTKGKEKTMSYQGLETSNEIVEAIEAIASEDRSFMAVWEDPTPEEQGKIAAHVLTNWSRPPEEDGTLMWGEAKYSTLHEFIQDNAFNLQ